MRVIFFLLLVFPVIVNAQFERSATELSKETIKEYITTKLFKSSPYQTVSYGEIKSSKEADPDVKCSTKHKFLITEFQINNDQKASVQKLYSFVFYFDEKMKVLRAETSYSN